MRMYSDEIVESTDRAGRAAADRALQARQLRNQERQAQLDEMVKYAGLAESGYSVRQAPQKNGISGMFGGGGQMTLEKDPAFTSLKELQRQKAVRELDPDYMTAYQRARVGSGDGGLTAGQRTAKDKATNEIFSTVETNKVKRNTLDNALAGAEKVPSGFFGKAKLNTMKFFGSKDPVLQDAQELKMALTDATLAETAHTKGAISDSEMGLFRAAAANDDFNNPGVQPVLAKMRAFLDADEAGKYGAYQKNYGEDPRTWFGQGAQQGTQQPTQAIDPLEAEAQQAIANGADRNAVMQRLQQMRGKR